MLRLPVTDSGFGSTWQDLERRLVPRVAILNVKINLVQYAGCFGLLRCRLFGKSLCLDLVVLREFAWSQRNSVG